MIVDYYIIKRRSYMQDILRDTGGKYWYSRGTNWVAIAVWVIGAGSSYLLTYVWVSPMGATIPAFVLSFALYYLLSISMRSKFAGDDPAHLGETVSIPTTEK